MQGQQQQPSSSSSALLILGNTVLRRTGASSQRACAVLGRLLPGRLLRSCYVVAQASKGNLHVLKALHERGDKFPSSTVIEAWRQCRWEVYKWLRSIGVGKDDPELADTVARLGYLDLVRLLREEGQHCTTAAADHALKWLQWNTLMDLLDHGIQCSPAAVDEHVRCGCTVRSNFLAKYGIFCSREAADYVVQRGNLRMTECLAKLGVFCSREAAEHAGNYGSAKMCKLLQQLGVLPKPFKRRP